MYPEHLLTRPNGAAPNLLGFPRPTPRSILSRLGKAQHNIENGLTRRRFDYDFVRLLRADQVRSLTLNNARR
jgi:hypothetical protein